jgi:hypothetical protein
MHVVVYVSYSSSTKMYVQMYDVRIVYSEWKYLYAYSLVYIIIIEMIMEWVEKIIQFGGPLLILAHFKNGLW